MKKILTMILVMLMLVVTFAGCGGEEVLELEVPTETPPTNTAVHWSADEWVINGISVFSGSESIDAIAGILGAEPRYPGIIYEGGHTGTSIDAEPIINMAEAAAFSNPHNMWDFIQTAQPGVSLMRGITIGETSMDEVAAIFPMNDEHPHDFVASGDGGHVWRLPHDDEGVRVSFVKIEETVTVALYSIFFLDGIASFVSFTNELDWSDKTSFPPTNEPAPETEPTEDFDDSAFPLDATEIIYYQLGAAYDNTPFFVDGVEVTLQQFEADMDRIYEGARYRLVSYRSTRSEDSLVSSASSATDTFMTHCAAITRLGNETEQWAYAYLAILNGINTRPIAGHPQFGIGDFVEYGVDSVSIHDITGNNIPDIIFTNVSSSQPMTVSFTVYSFDGGVARRIIHIDNLESAGVSSPYYHAYFTDNGTLIINNNNTGFGRIHIFKNLGIQN